MRLTSSYPALMFTPELVYALARSPDVLDGLDGLAEVSGLDILAELAGFCESVIFCKLLKVFYVIHRRFPLLTQA
jgi:hypothetical protein